MRDWKNYLLLIVGLLSLAIISCRSHLDQLTPAPVPKPALVYTEQEPNDFKLFGFDFFSLADARDTKQKVQIKHRSRQLELSRQLQDDKLQHGDSVNATDYSIESGQIFQDVVIGSAEQPISILGILAGAGISLPIGRAMKRKGDLDPKEVEIEKAKARDEGRREANGKRTETDTV